MQQWETEAIKVLIILWAAEKVQGSFNLIASHVLKLPPVITPLEQPVSALRATKHNIGWILRGCSLCSFTHMFCTDL